jgi:hypothetical protein
MGKHRCPAYLETGSQHGGGRCGTAIFQHRIPSARFGSIDSGSLHVAYVRHEVISSWVAVLAVFGFRERSCSRIPLD